MNGDARRKPVPKSGDYEKRRPGGELPPARLLCFSSLFSFSFFDEIKNPAERIVEHGGFERVCNELSILAGRDEPGVFQQIEMIRNARGGHLEGFADLADCEVLFFEHFQDAAAGGITERFKKKVQRLHI
jgi:hypothetical protein